MLFDRLVFLTEIKKYYIIGKNLKMIKHLNDIKTKLTSQFSISIYNLVFIFINISIFFLLLKNYVDIKKDKIFNIFEFSKTSTVTMISETTTTLNSKDINIYNTMEPSGSFLIYGFTFLTWIKIFILFLCIIIIGSIYLMQTKKYDNFWLIKKIKNLISFYNNYQRFCNLTFFYLLKLCYLFFTTNTGRTFSTFVASSSFKISTMIYVTLMLFFWYLHNQTTDLKNLNSFKTKLYNIWEKYKIKSEHQVNMSYIEKDGFSEEIFKKEELLRKLQKGMVFFILIFILFMETSVFAILTKFYFYVLLPLYTIGVTVLNDKIINLKTKLVLNKAQQNPEDFIKFKMSILNNSVYAQNSWGRKFKKNQERNFGVWEDIGASIREPATLGRIVTGALSLGAAAVAYLGNHLTTAPEGQNSVLNQYYSRRVYGYSHLMQETVRRYEILVESNYFGDLSSLRNSRGFLNTERVDRYYQRFLELEDSIQTITEQRETRAFSERLRLETNPEVIRSTRYQASLQLAIAEGRRIVAESRANGTLDADFENCLKELQDRQVNQVFGTLNVSTELKNTIINTDINIDD